LSQSQPTAQSGKTNIPLKAGEPGMAKWPLWHIAAFAAPQKVWSLMIQSGHPQRSHLNKIPGIRPGISN
jgi:hypothetical protein